MVSYFMKCILFLKILRFQNVYIFVLIYYNNFLVFSVDDVFKLLVTFDVISEGSYSPSEIKDKISEQIQQYRRIDQFGVSAERFSFRNFGGKLCMLSV